MNQLIFGILSISLASLLYAGAWRLAAQQRQRAALACLLLAGLLLRCFAASDLFLHEWDERYHALVSKHLMDNPLLPTLYQDPVLPYHIDDWSSNHIWVHKQPFPLWCMALSMSIFGVNEWALRLPSVLLSTLGIAAMFYIARYFFNARIAFLAAFLFSIHGLLIELSAGRVATDHVDVFFAILVELAVLCSILYVQHRQTFYNVLAGVFVGLAVLSKWLPAFVVFPVWLLLLLHSRQFSYRQIALQGLLMMGVCVAVFLPWQCYIFYYFPAEALVEQQHNLRHVTEVLDGQESYLLFHFDKMRILFGELVYLPVLWFLWTCVRKRQLHHWAIAAWLLLPYLFFTLVSTKMQGYILFAAPAIFMITAYFWYFLRLNLRQFRYPILPKIVLILLLILPVRYSIERIKPFQIRTAYPPYMQDIRTLSTQIPKGAKVVVFGSPRPIETMFYTHCIAYPQLPEASTVLELKQKGYEVYVLKGAELERK